jgi:hypothetical protein
MDLGTLAWGRQVVYFVGALCYKPEGCGFDSQWSSKVVDLEPGPLSLVSTIEELLRRNSSGSGLEIENTGVGIHFADHATQYIYIYIYIYAKVGTNFADKRQSFGMFSLLAD